MSRRLSAAVYYRNGPPEVLQSRTCPTQSCRPGGAIKVEAISIEGGDGPGGHNDAIGPLYGQMARFADDLTAPGRDHLIEFLPDGMHMELQLPIAKTG